MQNSWNGVVLHDVWCILVGDARKHHPSFYTRQQNHSQWTYMYYTKVNQHIHTLFVGSVNYYELLNSKLKNFLVETK